MSLALASPKSNTLLIMSNSSDSMIPSSWLTSIIVLNSSSVKWEDFDDVSTRNIIKINFEKLSIIKMIGVKTNIRIEITLAYESATFSEWIPATVFGIISPKINTTKVRTNVPILTYIFPNTFCTNKVEIAEAPIFTMLFPIKTVLSIFDWCFITLSRIRARLLPSSTNIRIRILLTVVKAVSADEKNADSKIKTNNTHSIAMSLGPTISLLN